jgi:hypothetical protein
VRPRNKHITTRPDKGWDLEWLKETQKDYESIGFDTELTGNELVVFALPRRKKKKKEKRKRRQ